MARISEITVKQQPEKHMLTVRKTIDFFTQYAGFMESAVNSILTLIEESAALPSSGPIVCFHNMELETLDVEIGFEVARPIPVKDPVQASIIPVRTVATTIDRGPYEKQDPTLEALMQWIPENGYKALDGIYYHYLNDEQQPESEYLTQMFIPVK